MFLFRKVKKRGSMKPNDVKEALERFLTVSYTHLDVYKRQVLVVVVVDLGIILNYKR